MKINDTDRIVESAVARAKRVSVFAPPKWYIGAKKKRNHKKRHSVNKEKSIADKVKALKAKTEHAKMLAAMKKYHKECSLYWNGERETHPKIKVK